MKRGLSLTQKAYERLRADLLACRLLPGQKLNVNALCLKMGMSLGAVREALSRLTSEGLVTAERAKGFRATPISTEELLDLTRVRVEIESQCLRRSIAFGDAKWESNLKAAFEKLRRTPYRVPTDPRRLSDAAVYVHEAYHEALAGACDSEWLLRLRRLLHVQSERYHRLSMPLSPLERDGEREHRELMEAALARDITRAITLMTEHLEVTAQQLVSSPQLMSNSPAKSL